MASFHSRTMKILASATNIEISDSQITDHLLVLDNASPLLILDIPEITHNLEKNDDIMYLEIPLENNHNIKSCDPIENISIQSNSNEERNQRCEGPMVVDKEYDYQTCYNMRDIEMPSCSKSTTNDHYDQTTIEKNHKLDILVVEDQSTENESTENESTESESTENKSDYENNDSPLTSSEDGFTEPKKKRKKKHLVNKNTWTQKVNQLNREKGKKYDGRKKINGVWTHISKPKRSIGPRCVCKLSLATNKTKTSLECQKLTEDDRNEIFKKFWEEMNWEQRKTFVYLSVKNAPTKRHRNRKEEDKSRREYSFEYYLKKKDDSNIRVCKKMYLNTIAMGERMINIWKYSGSNERSLKSIENVSNDERVNNQGGDQQRPNKQKFLKEKINLQDFFENLPKVESHYCRASSTKKYLERTWISKSAIYKCYKDLWCKEKGIKNFSVATFYHVFDEMNLSLFTPKKDECDKCVSYRTGNLTEKEFLLHQEKKEEARVAKDQDKSSQNEVFCMDLQAVLLSPKSNVSSQYFKTKLMVHNFTLYDMKTGNGYCFIWHEAAGGVTANNYASILSYFLKEHVLGKMENEKSIIFWSDGCTSQNRNSTMSNALLNISIKYGVQIEQKYLEKGHTQMEADSMHSCIERRLKNVSISVPAEYVGVCLQARQNPRPYIVKYLTYDFFKDFDKLKFLTSIRPGRKVDDPAVTDLRAIVYKPNGQVLYKLRHNTEYHTLEYRNIYKVNPCALEDLPQLYQGEIPIKKTKYDHLQSLKASLNKDYHSFYDNLPFK